MKPLRISCYNEFILNTKKFEFDGKFKVFRKELILRGVFLCTLYFKKHISENLHISMESSRANYLDVLKSKNWLPLFKSANCSANRNRPQKIKKKKSKNRKKSRK